MGPTWAVEMNPKTSCATSTRKAEHHGGPSRERWRAFESDNNAVNSNQRKLGGLRQEQCPTKKQKTSGSGNSQRNMSGSGNSEREVSGSGNSDGNGSSDSDESGAGKPNKKEARGAAINATPAEQPATRSKYENLVKDSRKCTKAFKERSKREGHGHDRREIRKLLENINKLLIERSQCWSENQEEFRKETNYSLMKLQYEMALKSLGDVASWIEITENTREITRDEMDGDLSKTASLPPKARGKKEAALTLSPLRECPVIKFVSYERKDDSTGTDGKSELTGNTTTKSESSTVYSSDAGNGER